MQIEASQRADEIKEALENAMHDAQNERAHRMTTEGCREGAAVCADCQRELSILDDADEITEPHGDAIGEDCPTPNATPELLAKTKGEIPQHAEGYPLIYVTTEGDTLCPKCAAKPRASIAGAPVCAFDIFYEGAPMQCDDCGEEIQSAYGDPDNEEGQEELQNQREAEGELFALVMATGKQPDETANN